MSKDLSITMTSSENIEVTEIEVQSTLHLRMRDGRDVLLEPTELKS